MVIDYNNPTKLEIIKCTVTGTAVSSITRGQDGTSDQVHSAGAKIGFAMVPSHYAQLGGIAASDGWTTWVPTYIGLSVNPTVAVAKYIQFGKYVTAAFAASAAGTSNATTFSMVIPVAAKNALTYLGAATDNSVALTAPAKILTATASTTLTFNRDLSGAAWTAAGGKNVDYVITYEAN